MVRYFRLLKKIEVIKKDEEIKCQAVVSRIVNIPESTIYRIKEKYLTWKKSQFTMQISSQKTIKKGKFSHIDQQIYDWFIRKECRNVYHGDLIAKSLKN